MTLEEIRKIRDRKSLETANMSIDELNAYFKKGADNIRKIMAEQRQEKEMAEKAKNNK